MKVGVNLVHLAGSINTANILAFMPTGQVVTNRRWLGQSVLVMSLKL
jgi:hypothetical protein